MNTDFSAFMQQLMGQLQPYLQGMGGQFPMMGSQQQGSFIDGLMGGQGGSAAYSPPAATPAPTQPAPPLPPATPGTPSMPYGAHHSSPWGSGFDMSSHGPKPQMPDPVKGSQPMPPPAPMQPPKPPRQPRSSGPGGYASASPIASPTTTI